MTRFSRNSVIVFVGSELGLGNNHRGVDLRLFTNRVSGIVDSSEGSYQVLVDFVMRYSFYTALTVKVGVDNLKIYQLCAKYLSGVKDEATEIEITKGCCVVHHALGSQVNQSGVEFPFASYRFWVTRASWISKESIMVWTALLRLSPLPTVSQQWKSFAEINRRGSLCNYLSVSYISEVHVEGLETLDYFDNLSQRERYSEQAVAITFDTESNARNKLQQFQLKTSERSMQHSSEVLICHVQDLHKYRSNLTMDCGNREPGS
ncbi:hypothetical protein ACS0TY_020669 [Phlomoides rotata]